jgi:purine-binding chemotaxis protein CheW
VRLLLFMIDDHRYGITAQAVAEIVRAVAVTPLPNAPAVITGVIDVRGTVIPVFDLRRRFGLLARDVELADHFIIVRASRRMAVLHVDRVLELVDVDDAAISTLADQLQSPAHVAGVAALDDGLAVIHDVDTFLSRAEEESLAAALAAKGGTDTAHTVTAR